MLQQILREVMFKSMGIDRGPYDDIKESLDVISEELKTKEEESIDWSFVRLHLGNMNNLKRNSDFFHEIFSSVLRLFRIYRCRDFSVIADTFQLESFVFEYSKSSFKQAESMTEYMRNNISCIDKKNLNYVAQLMKMPYKNSASPYCLMYDVIQMYLISVDDDLLKQALEYGIMYIPLNDHRSTWSHCRQRMSILLNDSERRMLLSSHIIYANFKELSSESRRRMLAVFRGVEVILKARVPDNSAIDFGLCFRMAYETIPEPVITSKEVATFLSLVFRGSSDELIKDICQEYEKLFPESLEPYSPRTLKHLCRCQVKQNLRQAGTYPCGILDLNIPTDMKNYIHTVENDSMWDQYNSYDK